METKQLYEKVGDEFKPINPSVSLDELVDKESDLTLGEILIKYNHLKVNWKGDVSSTRREVPVKYRRNGLYITYNNGTDLITEYYVGNNNSITTETWTNDANWKTPITEDWINANISKLKPAKDSVGYEQLTPALRQLVNQNTNVTNYPDDEDLTSQDNLLKFKNREYDPDEFSGKGYVILRKNLKKVNGVTKNILEQSMINKENTIYEIRYDFDLNSEQINIPENCILKFEGGSLNNGTLNENNTFIKSPLYKIFNNIKTETIWNTLFYPEWFGAKGNILYGSNSDLHKVLNENEANNDTIFIQKCLDFSNNIILRKKYKVDTIIVNSYKNIKFDTIIGNIKIKGNYNKLIGNNIHGDSPLVLQPDYKSFGCSNNYISINYIYNTLYTTGDCILLDGSYSGVQNNVFENTQTNRGAYGIRLISGKYNYDEKYGNSLIGFCNQNYFKLCVSTNAKCSALCFTNYDNSNKGSACLNGNVFYNYDPEKSYKVLISSGYTNIDFYSLRLREFFGNYSKNNQFNDESLENKKIGSEIIEFDRYSFITFINTSFNYTNFKYISDNSNLTTINENITFGNFNTESGSTIFESSKILIRNDKFVILPKIIKEKIEICNRNLELTYDSNPNVSSNVLIINNVLTEDKRITIDFKENCYYSKGINKIKILVKANNYSPIIKFNNVERNINLLKYDYDVLYEIFFNDLEILYINVFIVKQNESFSSIVFGDNSFYGKYRSKLFFNSDTNEINYYLKNGLYASIVFNIHGKTFGNTNNRPTTEFLHDGYLYFDTTLNKPIWWTGSKWVDSTGADV